MTGRVWGLEMKREGDYVFPDPPWSPPRGRGSLPRAGTAPLGVTGRPLGRAPLPAPFLISSQD